MYISTACHWLAGRGGVSPSQIFFGTLYILYQCMDRFHCTRGAILQIFICTRLKFSENGLNI